MRTGTSATCTPSTGAVEVTVGDDVTDAQWFALDDLPGMNEHMQALVDAAARAAEAYDVVSAPVSPACWPYESNGSAGTGSRHVALVGRPARVLRVPLDVRHDDVRVDALVRPPGLDVRARIGPSVAVEAPAVPGPAAARELVGDLGVVLAREELLAVEPVLALPGGGVDLEQAQVPGLGHGIRTPAALAHDDRPRLAQVLALVSGSGQQAGQPVAAPADAPVVVAAVHRGHPHQPAVGRARLVDHRLRVVDVGIGRRPPPPPGPHGGHGRVAQRGRRRMSPGRLVAGLLGERRPSARSGHLPQPGTAASPGFGSGRARCPR